MNARQQYHHDYYMANRERLIEINKRRYHARKAAMTPEEREKEKAYHRLYERERYRQQRLKQ